MSDIAQIFLVAGVWTIVFELSFSPRNSDCPYRRANGKPSTYALGISRGRFQSRQIREVTQCNR